MKKLLGTIRALYCMGMARHFGRYIHTIGGSSIPVTAVYEWRGKRWQIPLGPVGDYNP